MSVVNGLLPSVEHFELSHARVALAFKTVYRTLIITRRTSLVLSHAQRIIHGPLLTTNTPPLLPFVIVMCIFACFITCVSFTVFCTQLRVCSQDEGPDDGPCMRQRGGSVVDETRCLHLLIFIFMIYVDSLNLILGTAYY